MPLLGKIVVIKRNGADGTEFPLTASCLFGRKLDCDIRIQLPQVSKEHCRIEQNENKELILTNLSSVNPTRINGDILQQSERLKHGDLITIIDRSFRFEYPPPPTPKKKRLSTSAKGEAIKVLQDQQVRSTPGSTEKKKLEHSDTCLKDGSNLLPSGDQSFEATKGDNKEADTTMSPFTELYQMVKRDLASKSPWKAAVHPKSPLARPQLDKEEPKKILASHSDLPSETNTAVTPKSAKKNRRSSDVKAGDCSSSAATESTATAGPVENPPTEVQEVTSATQNTPMKQKRRSSGPMTPSMEVNATPMSQKKTPQMKSQKFNADEVAQQILTVDSNAENTQKSPKSRRSRGSQPQSPAVTPKSQTTPQTSSGSNTPIVNQSLTPTREAEESERKQTPRTSPRTNAGKRFQVQDVLSEILSSASNKASGIKHKYDDLPKPVPKRKRVSFGGQLSPELFDKRLPPNSPLRRGATPGRRSLGFSQKSQSLLRRASTIGLMGFQLDETVPESPSKNASPKRASTPGKSPKDSPAKKSPSPKAKTPSPKNKTSTQCSSPTTPKTPASGKRISNVSVKTPSPRNGSLIQTPTTQGRFSITRITTPSPDREGEETKVDSASVFEVPEEYVTPKRSSRRISMKASARKTPKSALKCAFEVMRSRRSGASRANFKVISSWADVVKFGQVKPQGVCGTKKIIPKNKAPKRTKVAKPKTPARRVKNETGTGHADSPATIVIGKAYLRSAQPVGAAPKIVPNIALFKKDMKMDEDLSGVADIFKTPANSKQKNTNNNEYSKTPLGASVSTLTEEMSVMNTPEESGEMIVSPMSVASTAKRGHYNSEAVKRLLQDSQEVSLIEEDSPQVEGTDNLANENNSDIQMSTEPQVMVQTAQQEREPLECLTGVKKLMRTPKQRSEPVDDLRGKLLKTPKEPKSIQEENFEGVRELLKTPKQRGTPVDDMAGLKKIMKTPKVRNSPVVCAVALKKLLNTPKEKIELEEDLTGVKQLMRTPKVKGQPVENAFGVQRLMKTPKQKCEYVEEDLTGVKQIMKTPKQKSKPVEEDLTGIKQMLKTPKQKNKHVEEDLTGIQQLMKTPKQESKPVEEDLTEIKQIKNTPKEKNYPVEKDLIKVKQMQTPKPKSKPAVEEDLAGIKQTTKTPKEKGKPVEEDLTGIKKMMKTPKQKKQAVEEDLTGIQQLMKTPKQKSKLVEDLTGIKRLLQTPKIKDKGEPVENDFGLSRLMKSPQQGEGEVVENFTELEEPVVGPVSKSTLHVAKITEQDMSESAEVQEPLTSVAFEDLTTESDLVPGAYEEFENKENICPVEDMKNETEATVVIQTIAQEERESNSVNISSYEVGRNAQEHPAQESEDTTPSLPVSKEADKPEELSSAQKSHINPTFNAVAEMEEEITVVKADPTLSVPVKGRRGKMVTEEVVAMASPLRKSARGRVPKQQFDEKEANNTQSLKISQDVEETECLPVMVKPKRGRKAEQNKVDPETKEAPAEVEVSLKSPAPATKGKRGHKCKQESEKSLVTSAPEQPQENMSEAVVEKEDATPQKGELEPGVQVDADTEITEPSAEFDILKSPPPATKGKRGRKRKQESDNSSVILASQEPQKLDMSEDAVEKGDAAAQTVNPEPVSQIVLNLKSPAPVTKGKRGRKCKKESENPVVVLALQEPEPMNMPESVVDKEDTAPEKAELESSAETDAPVKANARTRRGRLAKKDSEKTTKVQETEPTLSAESDLTSSTALEVTDEQTQIPVVKLGRGRRAKPGTMKDAPVVDEPKADVGPVVVESEEKAILPVVKSGRGTKSKCLKPDASKVVDDQPSVEETSVTVTETVVKNVRSGQRTKQPKAVPVSQENAEEKTVKHDAAEESEAPIKSIRGRRAAVIMDEPEGPLRRGRRAAPEVPPPVMKPSRGRKGAVKAEQEAPKASVSQANPESNECGGAEDELPVKRGRYAKAKVTTKDSSVNKAEDPAAVEKADSERNASNKAVNWKSDLVTWKNIEVEEVQPQQKSKKKALAKASTEDASVSDTKQAVNTPAKIRKGRSAKKQDDPHAEESETAAEEEPEELKSRKQTEPAAKSSGEDSSVLETKQSKNPPAKGRKGTVSKKQEQAPADENAPIVRRGRAGVSLISKPEVVPTGPKRGTKRKELEVADEMGTVESLPKRRKGKADTSEAPTEVATASKGRRAATKAAAEVVQTEPEQSEHISKNDDKPVRGKRKAAQEVDSVLPQCEDPASEVSTRRGTRGQKKNEPDTASAPVRRTRRK
ncbi:proliferation marker protein Ki-67 [Hoplias malabaricus]|uniref:proliferation marker protein Ki-67 n=1 Tax=Hoplias malabaricus TaxID=27720 RepID=UPI003461FBD1